MAGRWTPETIRPELLPPHLTNTRESMALVYEDIETRIPPEIFYLITTIIYLVDGDRSEFIHAVPCDPGHQLYHYRHSPSNSYLRTASYCRECVICPTWTYEHFHRPSKACTIRCGARPVFRPFQSVRIPGHDCRDHICSIPLWYARKSLQEYPQLPYTPIHETYDSFRISQQIAKNGVKPLIIRLAHSLCKGNIQNEQIISPEHLFDQ